MCYSAVCMLMRWRQATQAPPPLTLTFCIFELANVASEVGYLSAVDSCVQFNIYTFKVDVTLSP